MTQRWFIGITLFIFSSLVASSQEVITGLIRNHQLDAKHVEPQLKNAAADEPLALPFIDDFSHDSLYPSAERWADRLVFVNNTFSVSQPSLGIATFDCLDGNGLLYDNASLTVFPADSLTSLTIDLNYPPGDSIYLSFLYEAGGIADMPERDDSLTLSFWAPEEEAWYSIWSSEGELASGFHRAMIPVTDSRFLKSGFRFRFTGYASLSGILSEPSQAGNADQWNLDYVILDRERSFDDTVMHDVALTLPQRSLVKGYEAMPWQHFRKAYLSLMSPTATIRFRNNDTIVRNVTRHITIEDLYTGGVVYDKDAGASNVSPMEDLVYDAPLLYTYNTTAADSALFLVTVSLITDEFDRKENDTIKYAQRFSDYFAIDDGSAEAGYGINGQGSRNAMSALLFRSYAADSVVGISICFNDAYQNANQRAFDIMVWADDNGQPGILLGSTEGPVADPGSELNGFTTYMFDTPVSVNGNFWIGWRQLSETFLNAGLDLNTDPAGRQYFMLSGEWTASQAPGTVMMRPVMKGSGSSTSSDDGTIVNDLFKVFPNPTSGEITLSPSDSAPDDFIIDVIASTGARVISFNRTGHLDLSHLAAGTYFLLVKTPGGVPLSLLRIIKVN